MRNWVERRRWRHCTPLAHCHQDSNTMNHNYIRIQFSRTKQAGNKSKCHAKKKPLEKSHELSRDNCNIRTVNARLANFLCDCVSVCQITESQRQRYWWVQLCVGDNTCEIGCTHLDPRRYRTSGKNIHTNATSWPPTNHVLLLPPSMYN